MMDAQTPKTTEEKKQESDALWEKWLTVLENLVAEGEVTQLQRDAFHKYWNECRRRYPNLRYPTVSLEDNIEGQYLALNWWFIDIDRLCSIDIFRDGKIVWFYNNYAPGSDYAGSEDPEDTVPEIVYEHLAHFTQPLPVTATT